MKYALSYLASVCAVALVPAGAFAGDVDDLGALSLESLGEIVTSVSKKPEDSFRSAAAVYVINNQDIKHSGATHIADVLRGVPGLNVARVDANNWAITSRGFNGSFSNKLLVLVDGRTIYTPSFSGVYWNVQNMPLDDIERIEVIRGPGASLWGANAVNGIINIITKSARDTQGVAATTLVGNEDRNVTDARYGGKIGEDAYYRVYGHYERRDSTEMPQGVDSHNDWHNKKSGFRADWKGDDTQNYTVQGDIYDAKIGLDSYVPSFTDPSGYDFMSENIHAQGFNVLGRWESKQSANMNSKVQAYTDYQSHKYSSLQQEIYTFDLDYQTALKTSDRNDLIWGAGARIINSDFGDSFDISLSKDTSTSHIISAFLQDQYALSPNELYFTVGSKLEHNNFTGVEVEPSARLAWYPADNQTVWGAVSRSVRMPSILEKGTTLNFETIAPGVIAQQQAGNKTLSEENMSYELGYRIKPRNDVTIDSTVFLNDYDQLRTFEPLLPQLAAGGTFLPFELNKIGKGKTHGFESSVNWDVNSSWSLLANYSYLNINLDENGSLDPSFLSQEDAAPAHQVSLRSQLFLPYDVQLINAAHYVTELDSLGIDDYLKFDTQLFWQPTTGVELSLVGQNLLDNSHSEFSDPLSGAENEISRAVYGRVTLRY